MPLHYLRRLTGSKRTDSANRHLARYLAFVAGAANAGGFLAVRQYTSHMSGIVSAMADGLAVWSLPLVMHGLAATASLGEETSSWPYKHDRDLTGFVDGSENPTLLDAPEDALLPEGVPGAAGSVLLLQK